MLQALPEDTDLGLYLSCLRAAIDKMELQFAAVAADFAGAEQWDDEGANSAADWLRFHCHMTSGAAWNALQVGKQLSKLAQSLEALRQGEIGYAHLATLANTANKLKGFEESELLPLAKEHSPGKFHYQVLHYRHARERQAYEREQEDLFQARSLNLSTAQDGCLLISGVLDPVAGAAVRGALEPLARPSGEHDDRRREQRLADALYERVTGNTPVSLQVTATVETLRALAGAAGGEMEFSLPLPAGPPCSAWPATPASCASSSRPTRCPSTSAAPGAWSTAGCARPWRCATSTASGRAASVRPPGATAITWCTGWTAGRPTSRTRSCSASATTAWSTRVDGS